MDTGSQSTYFLDRLTYEIWATLEVKPEDLKGGRYFPRVNCALGQSKGTIDLVFGSVTIPILLSAPIRPISGGCEVGVAPTPRSLPANVGILGLNLLSNIYLVFDITHNEISLAPTKKEVADSNIVEYSKYSRDQRTDKGNKILDSNALVPPINANELISNNPNSPLTNDDPFALDEGPTGAAALNPSAGRTDGPDSPGSSAGSILPPKIWNAFVADQNPATREGSNSPSAGWAALDSPTDTNQFLSALNPADSNGFLSPSNTNNLTIADSVPGLISAGESEAFVGGQNWLQE